MQKWKNISAKMAFSHFIVALENNKEKNVGKRIIGLNSNIQILTSV